MAQVKKAAVREAILAAIAEPRARMRRILTALGREIPSDANGFANNLMQSLSTAARDEIYSPEVLHAVEQRVAAMVDGCLPRGHGARPDSRALAHLSFMAFDGFAMHTHLRTGEPCSDAVIDTVCDLLFPPARAQRRPARRAIAAD